jgi:hypothetical protein
MAETYDHHRALHSSIIILMAAGVYFAGARATGGYENAWDVASKTYKSALGLKNFNSDGQKQAAQTSAIGTAAAECLGDAPYGIDIVHPAKQNPGVFSVYIKKLGQGSLQASNVEACILDHTGLKAALVEEKQ